MLFRTKFLRNLNIAHDPMLWCHCKISKMKSHSQHSTALGLPVSGWRFPREEIFCFEVQAQALTFSHTHIDLTLTSEASSEEWTYSSQAPKAYIYIYIYLIPIYEDKVRNITARETSSFLPCRHFIEVQSKMLGEQWIRKREGETSKMKGVSSRSAWGIHVKTTSIIKSGQANFTR